MKLTALLAGMLFAAVLFNVSAVAQRGSQHLNSPGYQRALAESRKARSETTAPMTTGKERPRQKRTR